MIKKEDCDDGSWDIDKEVYEWVKFLLMQILL